MKNLRTPYGEEDSTRTVICYHETIKKDSNVATSGSPLSPRYNLFCNIIRQLETIRKLSSILTPISKTFPTSATFKVSKIEGDKITLLAKSASGAKYVMSRKREILKIIKDRAPNSKIEHIKVSVAPCS